MYLSANRPSQWEHDASRRLASSWLHPAADSRMHVHRRARRSGERRRARRPRRARDHRAARGQRSAHIGKTDWSHHESDGHRSGWSKRHRSPRRRGIAGERSAARLALLARTRHSRHRGSHQSRERDRRAHRTPGAFALRAHYSGATGQHAARSRGPPHRSPGHRHAHVDVRGDDGVRDARGRRARAPGDRARPAESDHGDARRRADARQRARLRRHAFRRARGEAVRAASHPAAPRPDDGGARAILQRRPRAGRGPSRHPGSQLPPGDVVRRDGAALGTPIAQHALAHQRDPLPRTRGLRGDEPLRGARNGRGLPTARRALAGR